VQNEREFAAFCERVLRQPDLARDSRFSSGPARHRNRDAMHREIDAVFAALPSAGIVERLEAAGIANARLNDMGQFWRHPQLAARGRWAKVGSSSGPLDMLKPPFNLSGLEPRMEPIPALGEHSRAILAELGYGEAAIDRLRDEKAV
jgi:crotonobetainyl-CoA:carnitine CoA-transferase CaiB-like acyl-CoA transferase